MVTEEDIQNMSPEQIAELQQQNCVFCKIVKGEVPSKIVHEDKLCTAILDINPANEGHILIIPKEHYQIMPQVPEDVLGHMFVTAKKVSKALLTSTLGKSTSIFVANGAAAGQKAPHFMIHVIPRKEASEFFSLPSKEANPPDLEKLQEAIISKLSGILGKAPIEEQPPQLLPSFEDVNPAPKIEPLTDKRKVAKAGVKKEPGYLYYVDKEGDVARAPMARGGKKKTGEENKKKKPNLDDTSSEENSEDTSSEGNSEDSPSREMTLDDVSRMFSEK